MASSSINLKALIFEFFGTLTYVYTYAMTGPNIVLGITLWVLGLIGEKISGAHINPAITLVNALRK